jgi:hypothetical protein
MLPTMFRYSRMEAVSLVSDVFSRYQVYIYLCKTPLIT